MCPLLAATEDQRLLPNHQEDARLYIAERMLKQGTSARLRLIVLCSTRLSTTTLAVCYALVDY